MNDKPSARMVRALELVERDGMSAHWAARVAGITPQALYKSHRYQAIVKGLKTNGKWQPKRSNARTPTKKLRIPRIR